jgi:hypothetical protein
LEKIKKVFIFVYMKILYDYSREELLNRINLFESKQNGLNVITEYKGRTLRDVEVSKQYKFFDFKEFVIDTINEFETKKNLKIVKYSLTIFRGKQEITLYANEREINGDLFYQSIFILNSTDKSAALQFNAGVYKSENKTSMILPLKNALVSNRIIHKGKGFESKIDVIKTFTNNLDIVFNQQCALLNEYSNYEFSLKDILNEIINDNKTNEIYSTASIQRASNFTNLLVQSILEPYSINARVLTSKEKYMLYSPVNYLRNSNFEIRLSVYFTYLLYMDIFSNKDSSIIKRESFRFSEFLSNLMAVDKILISNEIKKFKIIRGDTNE